MPTDRLPRRPYVELPPPPGGLVAAVAEAGRRRRRRAVLAGAGVSGTAVVVAMFVMLMGGGAGGDAILRPAPAPPAGAVSPAPHSSRASAPEGVNGAAPASPRPGSLPAPPPAPKPASSTGSAPSGHRPASIVLTRTSSAYTGEPRVCRTGDTVDNSSVNPGQAWCSEAAATPVDGGERLALTLCRDSTSSGSLTFASSREVDFVVKRGSAVVWSWSHAHPGASSPHTLTAASDACWTWALIWPGVTQSGADAGHGPYTLVATSASNELNTDEQTVAFDY